MPRCIAILPDAVADQIAAGEVVERPASVVKELVENALDAGARHIRVELESGGKVRIEVSDDGSGMGREDAVLALDRHATSKVRSAADLVGVSTFGFRGEALPAIASVSRLTLSTTDGTGEGTELSVNGGEAGPGELSGRQRGTTVQVRGLFYNTPARRKFLRSLASETRAAHEVVATLALAHPHAGFELHVDGTCRLAVPADQKRQSVWLQCGDVTWQELCPGRLRGRCISSERIHSAAGRRSAHGPAYSAVRERPAFQGSLSDPCRGRRDIAPPSIRATGLLCICESRSHRRMWM
jgi:DNA mismatch repair protein MutL